MWAGCPHPASLILLPQTENSQVTQRDRSHPAGFLMRLPHIAPYSHSPLYFFTACTCQRHPLLDNPTALGIISEVWQKSAALDGWCVGRFVLMPDHVHFFAMPALGAKRRAAWHKMWKSVTARRLAEKMNLQPPIWQSDTFDHILRGAESYAKKWDYVRNNPVRAGLCRTPEEWPWQGEISSLQFLNGG